MVVKRLLIVCLLPGMLKKNRARKCRRQWSPCGPRNDCGRVEAGEVKVAMKQEGLKEKT